MFLHYISYTTFNEVYQNSNQEQCGEVPYEKMKETMKVCGEICHAKFGRDAPVFFCQKGEKCCPTGTYTEECSVSCGPYDPEGVSYFF